MVEVRDAEVWQLVDQRLDAVRRLPLQELTRRASGADETEVVELASGVFRRRTRVVALPRERFGLTVAVHVEGGRSRAEGRVIITSEGALAPEWQVSRDPPRANPFAFGPRVTIAGAVLAALLLLIFFLLT